MIDATVSVNGISIAHVYIHNEGIDTSHGNRYYYEVHNFNSEKDKQAGHVFHYPVCGWEALFQKVLNKVSTKENPSDVKTIY